MIDLTTLGGWVVALLTVIITGVLSLRPKKGEAEHKMIDQMQESISRLDARLSEVEAINKGLHREIRIRDDYIFVLRKQINDGEDPPPKPWPEELLK